MKTHTNALAMNRRAFLRRSGNLAIGASALAVLPTSVFAGESQAHFNATLLRMARDIYPHDALEDRYYWEPVKGVIDGQGELLADGVKRLDAKAREGHGRVYRHIATEPDRVRILRAEENEAYFQAVRTALLFGIYNNKSLWEPFFGYEGSSWEKGGYINRGFNDLDWL